MLPVLVVPSPRPRRHFGAAAGGVHPIITAVRAELGQSPRSPRSGPGRRTRPGGREDFRSASRGGVAVGRRYFTSVGAGATAGAASSGRVAVGSRPSLPTWPGSHGAGQAV